MLKKIFITTGIFIFIFSLGVLASAEEELGELEEFEILAVDVFEITDTAAEISWVTTEDSNSAVQYGVTYNNLSESASSDALTMDHSLVLDLLSPSTTYYYKVFSKLEDGITEINSEVDSFTTLSSEENIDIDEEDENLLEELNDAEDNISKVMSEESETVAGDNNEEQNNNIEEKFLTSDFSKNQIGKILLQVESEGEAWYLSPNTNKAYYLGRPDDAFKVMREQGVGIINQDLYKIPIGIIDSSEDTDKDSLSDNLEDALGLDKNKADTDGDGYADGLELKNGYSPWGTGKQNLDNNFANKQKGKIFLQVEKNGEAWYVNPNDGKRYFLGRPTDAFNAMRNLGLGISENDFENIK